VHFTYVHVTYLLVRSFVRFSFCRPSGDFQPFESAAAPPAPPMQASPVMPVATPAPALSANIAPSSSVDLLGDLDLSPPSMPLSVPVQPQSFAVPPAAGQSSVFDMTVPVSSAVVPEAVMTFTTMQPNALTTSAFVPSPTLTAASLESSVCTLNISSDFPANISFSTVFLYSTSSIVHILHTLHLLRAAACSSDSR